jgi:lipopolysaccharide/colanic/teichoic acid biosynthesis glycosyltransferase
MEALSEVQDDRPRRWFSPRLKICVDALVAAGLLVLLSPVMVVAAILVKMTSKGPVFFGDEREGKGGQVFRCYKFRTMREGAAALQRELYVGNQVDGPQFKLDHDPRITPVGRIFRATNVDELPQLFNVLMGQMSLVGPRPSPFRENQVCVPWREARLSVRPGMTGLWQVCRRDRSAGDFHQWIHYDMMYVRHFSLLVDLKILVATVLTILAKRPVPLTWIIPTRQMKALH